MRNVTVTIDRSYGSNIAEAKVAIERVLDALKPLRDEGLRIRVAVAPDVLNEKRWSQE